MEQNGPWDMISYPGHEKIFELLDALNVEEGRCAA
jgi:hypothetical protein